MTDNEFNKLTIIARDDLLNFTGNVEKKYNIFNNIKISYHISKHLNNFFSYYPLLFYSLFKEMPVKILLDATVYGDLYYYTLIVLDNMLDNKIDFPIGDKAIISHILHKEAILGLNGIFPNCDDFWNRFSRYYDEFINANVKSLEISKSLMDFDVETMEKVNKGKSAVAKNSAGIYTYKYGNHELIDIMNESQDMFHIGIQLIDDLQDWKKDLTNKQISYLLFITLKELGIKSIADLDEKEIVRIGKSLVILGTAEHTMELATGYLTKAFNFSSNYQCPQWKDTILKYQKTAENLCVEMKKMREQIFIKQDLSALLKDRLDSSIYHAIEAILDDKRKNFECLSHMMHFSKERGFSCEEEWQKGDIFQRSLVCETFLEAKKYGIYINDDFIKDEIDYLISRKLKSVKGGWNYFPDLPEQPPDTDDLAQIIRLLVKNRDERIELCTEPIELLMDQNIDLNGSFKTWIIDRNDFSDGSLLMRKNAYENWGLRFGKDVEVTANMAISLSLLNNGKYDSQLQNAMEFIVKQQNKGKWESEWYVGQYYGTYICLKALSNKGDADTTFHDALSFILKERKNDMGWGLDRENSDPLSTSLALLTLFIINEKGIKVEHTIIENAVSFLLKSRLDDHIWAEVPFITMLDGKYLYKSKMMTTNFVLRALLEYKHHFKK